MIKGHTPIEDGFAMPAEFDRQQAMLLIWPVRPGSWGRDQKPSQQEFLRLMDEILKEEDLYLLSDRDHLEEVTSALLTIPERPFQARVLEIPTDDAWARDVGPTFVRNKKGQVRGVSWSFNAWGGQVDGLYASFERDDAAASKVCQELGLSCYDASPFVLEGGSIHTDGEGTLITTKSCLLSKGRNPSLSGEEIEERLRAFLGIKKVLWLPRGIYMDETNEHVDNMCAFIRPGEVVLAWTDNEEDPQYPLSLAGLKYLEKERDAAGRKLIIHKIPIPDHPICLTKEDVDRYDFAPGEDVREVGERLAASYVNFCLINGAALIPLFGGANKESDQRALALFRSLLPERRIVGIPADQILIGGGNIHCVTQQIPAGRQG